MEQASRSDEEWRRKLTSEQYAILRKKSTERAFTGKLLYNKRKGKYYCAACGNEVFLSRDKFDSGSGWPSFTQPVKDGSVEMARDESHGVDAVEVTCSKCGSHLGHVFDDGPAPTGTRYCINSGALEFREDKG